MSKLVLPALCLALALGLLALGPAAVGGEETRPNEEAKAKSPQEGAAAQGAGDLALAHMLAEYGRRTKDPLALLSAARILKQTPTQEMTTRPLTRRPEGAVEGEKASSPSRPVTPADLLDEARGLAGENQALAAIAGWVESEQGRGRQGGPVCGIWRLGALSTQEFVETFTKGEVARVVLRGDGDTDLDLFVYDENGNLIDKDDDATDFCVCEWVPLWTGPFVIRVVNLGNVWNEYGICTN